MNYGLIDQTDNVDCNSGENKNKVTSKYFTKDSMDESLADFQEAKKSHSGPKTSKTNTKKPRKAPKRLKGQKDIRTALKPKKNDLITYTEKFDTVCKKSGIDVDTEELQLAIALSKSLQPSTSKGDSSQTEGSSQEKIKKIRTTLQEYGFRIPETKININNKRRPKKNYKLISISDTEKEQIVSDKYSQVLFTNIDVLNTFDDPENSTTSLFYKATNISYKDLKNLDIFYSVSSIEKSTSNGCLLRDWAKIPGRPASPKVSKDIEMNFSEVECSQDELDIVLSSPFIQTKRIINSKLKEQQNSNWDSKNINSNENNELIPNIIIETEKATEYVNEVKKINHDGIYRSCSPDIFEDEESVIEVIATNTTVEQTNNDIMDFTECVNNMPLKNNTFGNNNFSLSQRSYKDMTRRKSDDFMEITDCVVSKSQPIPANIDLTQISEDKKITTTSKNNVTLDLTQSSDSEDDLPEVYLGSNKNLDDTVPLNFSDYEVVLNNDLNPSCRVNHDVYDLTQTDTIESNQCKDIVSNKVIEILEGDKPNIYNCIGLQQNPKIIEEDKDLIQSSNVSNEAIIIAHNNIDFNGDTMTTEKRQNMNTLDLCPIISTKDQITDNNVISELQTNADLVDNIDLTQNSNASDKTVILDVNASTGMVEDEYIVMENNKLGIFNYSPDKSIIDDIPDNNVITDIEFNKDLPEDNVDLSQSSNMSTEKMDEIYENYSNLEHPSVNISDSENGIIMPLKDVQNEYMHLGKKDNISIDYDELSIINGDNVYCTAHHSGTSHNNECTNKIDNSHSSQGSAFVIDNNSEASDKTGILILEDDNCDEVPSLHYNSAKRDNMLVNHEVSIVNNADRRQNMGYNSNTPHTYKSKDKDQTDDSHSSQNSEFIIVDKELDYSLRKSKHENFNLGGISVLDDLSNNPGFRNSIKEFANIDNQSLPLVEVKDNQIIAECTPEKNVNLNRNSETPENDYIIKLDDVTPMPNYIAMSTPERNNELDKYGLKPFKRKRAIQLLTHIYNQTHPIIESMEDLPSPAKKFKNNIPTSPGIRRKLLLSPKEALEILESQDIYEVTNEMPDLKEIECTVEDWVFQKREKAKIHSCRVPLHIAFHNYVSCRRGLREAILRYEPVDIDLIHKQLVEYGHRYDPKELLRFMDKKCITVKTADNTKNNRY